MSVGQTTVRYAGKGRTLTIIGSTREFFGVHDLAVAAGQPLPDTDPRRGSRICVIGRTVQRELFGNVNPLGENLRIGEWRFRVVGVLARKGTFLGMDMDDIVIMPASTAMGLLNREGLFRIDVEARSFNEMDQAEEEVKSVLIDRHGDEDFTIFTQGAMASAFGNILAALGLALAGIAAVSLSVAGIGVMNVMLVSVSERTGEIGLWKAIGARRSQILAAFLTEAIVISGLGALAGSALGMAGVQVLARLIPGFPAVTPLWAVVAAVSVALGVAVVFGVLPARRAAAVPAAVALQKGR
jgi:putative ABC transport system permease protein